MPTTSKKRGEGSPLKALTVVLAVLLALSLCGLAVRYLYLYFAEPDSATVTVPGNLIGGSGEQTSGIAVGAAGGQGSGLAAMALDGEDASGQQAPVLELYEGHPGDNEPFKVDNMLPGDLVTRYFCVKAYHTGEIELMFRANVTEQTKSLGDVLHIKVTHLDSGRVLCDAAFSDVQGQSFAQALIAGGQGESTAYYQIDVSMDTSVGNEYQAAMLKADFEWYVEGEQPVPTESTDTTQSTDTTESTDTTQPTDTTESTDTTGPTDTTQSTDTTGATDTTPPTTATVTQSTGGVAPTLPATTGQPGGLTPPPQTGDPAAGALWVIAVVSFLSLAAVLLLRRRKEAVRHG